MTKHLYDIFANKWYHGGTIFFYSDTHFGDLDSYKLRFPELYNEMVTARVSACSSLFDIASSDDEVKYANKAHDDYKAEKEKEFVAKLDQMQIDNINKLVHKNDTLIILGDVGDIRCVKKLKAGYKVLILGNHDKGVSNYISKNKISFWFTDAFEYQTIDEGVRYVETKQEAELKFLKMNPGCKITSVKKADVYGMGITNYTVSGKENLFDEVYEGTLQIGPKIILSHEPCNYEYAFNIHGHVHNKNLKFHSFSNMEDTTSPVEVWGLNICAEAIDYTPVSINKVVDSGLLNKTTDIHRKTIDIANKRRDK